MAVDANWYSCHVDVISRSHARTAVGAAAYITGTLLRDRELEAASGYEPSDYTRKGGIEQWFITAPEDAPEWVFDAEALTNEAQAKDTRKNSCTARTSIIALPCEADEEGRERIAHDIAGYIAERYQVAVIASVHAPDRHGDNRNWHMHLWFTTREVDEHGLGAKTRVLDSKQTGPEEIIHIREVVGTIINSYLEDMGSDERVDHRSYKDRGMAHIPTIHMGGAANGLERKGIRTERGDINRAIRESNRKLDALVGELAVLDAEIAKEMEKEFLGDQLYTGTLDPEILAPEPTEASFFPTANDPPQYSAPEPEAAPNDLSALSWEEQKEAAQNPFESEMVKEYERQLREHGEVQEYGLGQNWFDHSLTMFENLYYGTIERVKGFWERYVTGRGRGRNRSVRRDDPDNTPDRDNDPGLGR